MESGVVPDITYTYAPALWDQNGYALELQGSMTRLGRQVADGSTLPTAARAPRRASASPCR
jgi:hypothetical protein